MQSYRKNIFLWAALIAMLAVACSPSTPIDPSEPAPSQGVAEPPVALDQFGPEPPNQDQTFVGPVRDGSLLPIDSYIAPTQAPAVPPVPRATPSVRKAGGLSATPNVRPSPTAQSPTAVPTDTPLEPVVTFQNYVVRPGDTLQGIAWKLGVSLDSLIRLNGIRNSNYLQVGQVLHVSSTVQIGRASGEKLIPDSEAVYSPAYIGFDTNAVVQKFGGYLANYHENVDGENLSGAQIVQLVSERFSVGPRLLLTVLEMQSGWVTGNPQNNNALYYPMGYLNNTWSGLYKQVWFAANKLNEGYYGKVYKTFDSFTLLDGTRLALSSQVNPGTQAIQDMFAYVAGYSAWKTLTGQAGFGVTYRRLFGDPFAHAMEPLVDPKLKQPDLRLPWENGHIWFYVGGPHGAWADGSAWAAVDFAPTVNGGTCRPSTEWAVAVSPGRIVQSEHGRVIENLSGQNFAGSGWAIMYMHMASDGRAAVGTIVNTGDGIGHPSCEGGVSQADHLHIARLYNGQWIAAADRHLPFVMGGWEVQGAAEEYDGFITRGTTDIGACNCRSFIVNGIRADSPQVENILAPDPSTAALGANSGGEPVGAPVTDPTGSKGGGDKP